MLCSSGCACHVCRSIAPYSPTFIPPCQAFLPETKGIPLEELDAYFETVPIFVPGSQVYVPDAKTREEELRQGKVMVPDGAESDLVDEKEKGHVTHVA